MSENMSRNSEDARRRMTAYLTHNDGRGMKEEIRPKVKTVTSHEADKKKVAENKKDETKATGGKAFCDKIKNFAIKYETTDGSNKNYTDYEDYDEMTDTAKRTLITKLEAEYTKKWEGVFGAKKGKETAQSVIKALWELNHPSAEKKPSLTGWGHPYGESDDECECCEYVEACDDTYDYVSRLQQRIRTFGCDENAIICGETEGTIKKKFGKSLANDYKSAIRKLFDTTRECGFVGYNTGCCLQATVSGRIYKGIESNTKEWLENYLKKMGKDCDACLEEKKKEWQDWENWEKRYE